MAGDFSTALKEAQARQQGRRADDGAKKPATPAQLAPEPKPRREISVVAEIDVPVGDAKAFFEYFQQIRNQAANELMAQQREVDVAQMTKNVMILGQLSRAFSFMIERKGALVLNVASVPA